MRDARRFKLVAPRTDCVGACVRSAPGGGAIGRLNGADGGDHDPFVVTRTWRLHPDVTDITIEDAQEGVTKAPRFGDLGQMRREPAVSGASAIGRTFLLAMAKDNIPSKMDDFQEDLEVDVNYAVKFRLRSIAAELIEPTGRGYVGFALPCHLEYLPETSRLRPMSNNIFYTTSAVLRRPRLIRGRPAKSRRWRRLQDAINFDKGRPRTVVRMLGDLRQGENGRATCVRAVKDLAPLSTGFLTEPRSETVA